MPRLEVYARGALAAAALIDRGDRRIQRAQPRDDAVGLAVRAPDQRAPGPDARPADPDAARELAEPGHLRVPGVDGVQLVAGGVDQEARRHLRMAGSGVEQRR